MPQYVVLINWTDQGVANFKDTLDRAEDAGKLAQQLGGELTEVLWCLGPYDIVAKAEMPDDETATAFSAATSARGTIRTSTMRAFSRDEMKGILDKVG